MRPQDATEMANSVGPNKTVPLARISVPILRLFKLSKDSIFFSSSSVTPKQDVSPLHRRITKVENHLRT